MKVVQEKYILFWNTRLLAAKIVSEKKEEGAINI